MNNNETKLLYYPVIKIILTRWSIFLGSNSTLVLLFIVDRTLRFKKIREQIPNRHFIDGVISADGEVIHAGIPMGTTSVRKSVAGLRDAGLIDYITPIVNGHNTGSVYTINTNAILGSENGEDNPPPTGRRVGGRRSE